VATVAAEVPAYAPATQDPFRAELESGVRMAFEGFAGLLTDGDDRALERIRRGAAALGRTEARRRRGIGALLTAYQLGTGVHWQEVSHVALQHQLSAVTMTELAALIFAFNEQLSAASVEGYATETSTRERNRELLAQTLLSGLPTEGMMNRAGWTPPETCTCVLVEPRDASAVLGAYPESLQAPVEDLVAVLVPDAPRAALLHDISGLKAVAGPTVLWQRTFASFDRATNVAMLIPDRPLDSEEHLVDLVLTGEPLVDLRRQVLAPLEDRATLTETLRAWLLNLGRRDAVAAQLFVHPQTVRYRMGQIREAYGDRLNDPEEVLKLVVALG
jgi:PucR C-terminal helix-turn-helix domain